MLCYITVYEIYYIYLHLTIVRQDTSNNIFHQNLLNILPK